MLIADMALARRAFVASRMGSEQTDAQLKKPCRRYAGTDGQCCDYQGSGRGSYVLSNTLLALVA
jgi:hypothetical protein